MIFIVVFIDAASISFDVAVVVVGFAIAAGGATTAATFASTATVPANCIGYIGEVVGGGRRETLVGYCEDKT